MCHTCQNKLSERNVLFFRFTVSLMNTAPSMLLSLSLALSEQHRAHAGLKRIYFTKWTALKKRRKTVIVHHEVSCCTSLKLESTICDIDQNHYFHFDGVYGLKVQFTWYWHQKEWKKSTLSSSCRPAKNPTNAVARSEWACPLAQFCPSLSPPISLPPSSRYAPKTTCSSASLMVGKTLREGEPDRIKNGG